MSKQRRLIDVIWFIIGSIVFFAMPIIIWIQFALLTIFPYEPGKSETFAFLTVVLSVPLGWVIVHYWTASWRDFQKDFAEADLAKQTSQDPKKLICLGKFESHYCEPWWWNSQKELYYRECCLMGCPFSETTDRLLPIGKTELVGQAENHVHNWDIWKTTADQTGLYIPPWLYKRECKDCRANQLAENLEKETK